MSSFPSSANIVREQFANGITVLVYENFAVRSVVVMGALPIGSADEPRPQNGLASLTASVIMRGTHARSYDMINAALEDIGADLGFDAAQHTTGFYGKALAEDLVTLLDLLSEALRQPTFPAEHVERVRAETMTGLHMREQDTRFRARQAFQQALFPPAHPYHYTVSGTLPTVAALTRDDLVRFHAEHYRPEGLIVVIVGAVRAADALAAVRARLADWTANPDDTQADSANVVASADGADGAAFGSPRLFVPVAGKTQSDIVMGTLGPARGDADFQAARLANSILGQFGMMGRLGAVVREELGLAYYAYSSLDAALLRPAWTLAAGVDPEGVDRAIEAMRAEIVRLVDTPIPPDDLADNQAQFVGSLPLQLEGSEGVAAAILNMELYGLGLDYLATYRDLIYSIDAEAVGAAARRWLDPARLIAAVAGPSRA